MRRYTSYARICVYMRLDQALPDSVSIFHDDYEWIQPLDFEHVPFRCRRCHLHGHLYRDCPLNASSKNKDGPAASSPDGFTKVTHRRRANKKTPKGKKPTSTVNPTPHCSNSFEVLNTIPEHTPQAEATSTPADSTTIPIISEASKSMPLAENI